MPAWLSGQTDVLASAAAKAALMYSTALLGLRIAHRRTLAQWTAIDFAAAVAVGAIIGRTAIAGAQSYLVGAVALFTILAAHAAVAVAGSNRFLGKGLTTGSACSYTTAGSGGTSCGSAVTEHDLFAQLRQRGVHELTTVRYVLYEAKGDLTVVREDADADGALVRAGLDAAAGFPPR